MYMAYFAGLVVVGFVLAFLSRQVFMKRPGGLGQPLPNPLGFFVPAILMALFSGARINLGDTKYYVIDYNLMVVEEMVKPEFKLESGILYQLIMYYSRLQSEDPYLLLMITAFITVVPVVYILYKYSFPFELGIAFFVLTGYYTFSMNGIRQYCAAGVLLLGSKFLLDDSWWKGILRFAPFVLVAWLFHASALIMIPIFFIIRRKAWSPFTMVILGGTVLATLAFDAILPSFLDMIEGTTYGHYAENGWFTDGTEGGSDFIRIIVLTVPLIMAFIAREKMTYLHGKKWDMIVNLSVLNLAFYILSLYNWIFSRFAIYTSIYVIIMMTYVIYEGFEEYRGAVYGSSLALYVFYFYNIRYSIVGYQSELF